MKAFSLSWLRRAALSVGTIGMLALGWAGYLQLSGNFHVVDKGILYRSAQLDNSQLKNKIENYGIRTIINLRGENPTRAWYVEEMKAVKATDVHQVNFALSSGKELTKTQIEQLIALLRDSPRPILVHCQAGADRSGLVSALYELLVAKRSTAEAAAQLSFRYGHFPWLRSSTAAMDRTFERVSRGLPAIESD